MKYKGKYKVGKVTDFVKKKGWFVGHFADDELLHFDLVEISANNFHTLNGQLIASGMTIVP
jgi:hypothetical protein